VIVQDLMAFLRNDKLQLIAGDFRPCTVMPANIFYKLTEY
jgi:hypothetical protein